MTVTDAIRRRLRRRSHHALNLPNGYNSFNDLSSMVAVGDTSLNEQGVKWCDFPIRFTDYRTLVSTKHYNRLNSLYHRTTSYLRRLSIIDMGVILLQHPSHISMNTLAYDIIGHSKVRGKERIRMAKNTPAPSWGVTQRAYNKYGTTQLSQDSFPWVPSCCKRTDSGLRDKQLEGTLCAIGRAGCRPVRYAIASLYFSGVLFLLYAVMTMIYLAMYSAARFAQHHLEREGFTVVLNSDEGYISNSMQSMVGLIIVSCLMGSIFNFLGGLLAIEWLKSRSLNLLQRECFIQNDLWQEKFDHESEPIDGSPKLIRKLYVLECQDTVNRVSALHCTTKLYHGGQFCGTFKHRVIRLFKTLLRVDHSWCVRYVEYPAEFEDQFHLPSKNPHSELSRVTLTKSNASGSDDSDSSGMTPVDANSPSQDYLTMKEVSSTLSGDEEEEGQREYPINCVPLVTSTVFSYTLFSPSPSTPHPPCNGEDHIEAAEGVYVT